MSQLREIFLIIMKEMATLSPSVRWIFCLKFMLNLCQLLADITKNKYGGKFIVNTYSNKNMYFIFKDRPRFAHTFFKPL
jgi:hypothetical protein